MGKYEVKTPIFEGPLDLLLDLVEKRKLFVNDLSLAEVTDDFIAYLGSHEEFPIGESAEFILVASTLMLVKSRSLLPMLTLSEEEEAGIEDLERRLALYKEVKNAANELKKIFGKEIIFEKTPKKTQAIVFSPDQNTDLAHLLASLQAVLNALPKKENLPERTIRKIISLEETIANLSKRISEGTRLSFSDFSGKDKISIIVGFLAMLELVKRGAIRVNQEGREIMMETESLEIPVYN